MRGHRAKEIVEALLARADVALNGNRPWDITVFDEGFYERLLDGGSRAAGEAYVDGWWDAPRLDELFSRLFSAGVTETFARDWRSRARALYARLFNRQTVKRSRRVAQVHYNAGNDLFRAMLGDSMAYTCAYWDEARDLDEAQEAKFDLVCRKLALEPGMSVLELGCGWGSFARHAAEKHGVRVVGLNIAGEQVELGRELCRGLPVELHVRDYREATGRFDRVVSIGIMEHIGPKNYRAYMSKVSDCLKDDGLAFIHTIAHNVTSYRCDPWFDKYIFPNGVMPSLRLLGAAMEGLFVLEDCHNIGPHYDPTLLAWHRNLTQAWPELEHKYSRRLYRKMTYYLLSSAGSFRSRCGQVLQMVMTKRGRPQPACRVGAAGLAPSVSAA